MLAAPSPDLARWPKGRLVASPAGNSLRASRKITSGIMANAERKKTI